MATPLFELCEMLPPSDAGRPKPPAGRGRAQELAEFAIVVPLLLLIVFGVLDLGRVFFAAITIANAAREGARYGMLYPSDTAGIVAAVRQEAQTSGIDLTDPAITAITVSCPDVAGCGSGRPIRVTVTHQFQLLLTMVFPGGTVDVMRYSEMMVP